MGSAKKTDFRAIRARRDAAMARPELREPKRKPEPVSADAIAAAIAAGKFTRLPTGKRR